MVDNKIKDIYLNSKRKIKIKIKLKTSQKFFQQTLKDFAEELGYSENIIKCFYEIINKSYLILDNDNKTHKYSFIESGVDIQNPFLDISGRFFVNPIKEYPQFKKSKYIILLNKIKNYLGSNPTEEDMEKCIKKYIQHLTLDREIENTKKIFLPTPFGEMEAIVDDNGDYPSIKIYFNDKLMSVSEVINETETVRNLFYNKEDDKPIFIRYR